MQQLVQFGISTHLFSNRPLSARHLGILKEYGFDLIELWAMSPHMDYLNPAYMKKLAGIIKAQGVKVVSVHAPFCIQIEDRGVVYLGLGDSNKIWRTRHLKDVKKLIELSSLFGAEAMVLHGLSDQETETDPSFAKKLLHEGLVELAPLAKQAGIRLVVENIYTRYSRTISLRKQMEKVNHPNVGICLDVGHANISENPEKAVVNCGARLFHMHLSDNHGMQDLHQLPFDGTINWKGVCRGMLRAKNLRYAILELLFTKPDHQTDLKKVREILGLARERIDLLEAEMKPVKA